MRARSRSGDIVTVQPFPGFERYATHHCVTGSLKHLYVDMGFLPYFDFPEEYHFGGHTVVVAGYDPSTDDVLVADRDERLHTVAWDVLEQARASTYKPFPPRHRWYSFDLAEARSPRPDEIREAIGEVCQAMLEPPIANLGVKGIRKAITETRKWPAVLDDQALRRTCVNVAMFIDHRGGTGGGIFRYMYAGFLEEAANLTGVSRLVGLAADLRAIGDQWELVARRFDEAARAAVPGDLLDQATEPMHEIADREDTLWAALAAVVGARTAVD